MNLELILFFVLLLLFVTLVVCTITLKKFRFWSNYILIIVFLWGLIHMSQKEGVSSLQLGRYLKLILQKGQDRTNFEIKNPRDENVKERIRVESDVPIENVFFVEGKEFFDTVDGGIGNNYIVYDVIIPPNQTASGVVVTADRVSPITIFKVDPQEAK